MREHRREDLRVPPKSLLPVLNQTARVELPWLHGDSPSGTDEAVELLSVVLRERERELDAVYASTSWRLSAPIRKLGGAKRRMHQLKVARRHVTSERVHLAMKMIRRGNFQMLVDRAKAMHRYRSALEEAGPRSALPAITVDQELWPADQPLISVIVPCVNYGHFLEECIDSLLAQTFSRFEVIVVDGGSTDPESLSAAHRLEEKSLDNVRFYFRDGQHLLGCNRNFGIGLARGKYVCSLDPDDRLAPTYLELAAYLLEVERFDVVGASVQHFGDRSDQWLVRPTPTLLDVIHENVTTSSAVFRRVLWQAADGYHDVGLRQELIYEDWKFWVRVMALGARVHNIQSPLFFYRKHAESLSSHALIPPLEEQRRAIATYNEDVLTPAAFIRSEQRSSMRYEVRDALANLKPANPGPPTVLVCLPFLPRAGAQRVASDVTRRLTQEGYRAVVITTVETAEAVSDAREWFLDHTEEIYALPELIERHSWRNFITYLIETRNIRAVWQIGSEFIYSELPYIRRRFPDVKILDSLFILGTHLYRNRELRDYIDVHVVETKVLEDYLLEDGEAESSVRRIPNGVDSQVWVPRARAPEGMALLRERARSRLIVGFAGRMADEKAPDMFLDIAARFDFDDGLHFVMAGEGPLERHIRRRASGRSLARQVDVVGAVDRPAELYSCFDVLVLPSLLEGRPNVVLECMSMGIPVIASNIAGLPELVQHQQTGYLCAPGDVDAFAEALRSLAASPSMRRSMSDAARLTAKALHSKQRSLDAFAALFEEVLGAPNPR